MAYLTFYLGDRGYALDASRIVEVIPLVHLTPLQDAPEYVSGTFQYRGKMVAAVDVQKLVAGKTSRNQYSTRIVVVDYRTPNGMQPYLGLIVERATDMIRSERGKNSNDSQSDKLGSVQRFNLEEILPPSAMKEILRK